MQLKEGKMTLRELSLWFGLKPDTISDGSKAAREKKLKILSGYADYHFEGRKLHIDKVYIDKYCPAMSIAEAEFEKEWGLVVDKETKKLTGRKLKEFTLALESDGKYGINIKNYKIK